MRVQVREHAFHGRLDQLLVRHVLDIVGADSLEDVAEQLEHAIGVGLAVLGGKSRRDDGPGDESHDQSAGYGGHDTRHQALHASRILSNLNYVTSRTRCRPRDALVIPGPFPGIRQTKAAG